VRDTGGLYSNTATVTITITAAPDPPVAVNDSYVVAEDSVLQINTPGVKSNDSDPDTAVSALTVSLVTGVQRGTLTLAADGSFVYTPFPNISGGDSFVYRLSDGTGSSTATATIAITETPDPPVAVNDAATTPEDTPVVIAVLANDSDPDTATLTLQSVTQGAHGTVTIVAGQARYAPEANFNGQDTFTYTITDGTSTATATVIVTISPGNDPPVSQNDAYTTPMNTALNRTAPGVLANDSDIDAGQTLTSVLVTTPSHGTVVLQATGAFLYTPANNYVGTDTYTYKANDGTADSNISTVTITITQTNRAPVAVDDAYTTPKNTTLNVQTPGVMINDTDQDQDQTLTAVVVTQPSHGTITAFQTHGAFSYQPTNNYVGTDTFTYRVNDGTADSNIATVTITITAINEPPVAVNDSYSTNKNQTLTVALPGILGNDSDPDAGDTITTKLISGTPASAGVLTLNANGSFTFVPANNYYGTTTFRYRAVDSHNAESNEAIVTIVVSNVIGSGRVCYDGGSSNTQYRAEINWERLTNGDIKARAVVSRNYADNTYGVNKLADWGNKKRDFKAVYNSDFGQLAFYDANGSKKIDFKIDLLTAKSGTPSGYGTLGVSGGDGGMVSGSASNIVALSTSMDLNMNAFGYVTTASNSPLKSYSPATNSSYATNATYPLWIWDMWYEATVKASTFGTAGFGYPRLNALHASPPKKDVSSWRLINCQ
jgi:VCBS repeat-containing protein